ncbi:carboxypeptidase M32 [Candidatus Woesearchaeota archaeon]|nr:carboxypeptidase M32 [Candidatus Woesearchaeota archaeon]
MKKEINLLNKYQKEIILLSYIENLMDWDIETYMPKDGAKSRAEQVAFISELIHKKITSDNLFRVLNNLKNSKLKGVNRILVDKLNRVVERKRKLPESFVKELSKTKTLATMHWREARKKNNFKRFEPYLKKIVELKKQESNFIGLKGHSYNSLLDEFEDGMTTEKLKPIFNKLKKDLVPLHKKIEKTRLYKDDIGKKEFNFDPEKLKILSKDMSIRIGLNESNSRIDISPHPFSQIVGLDDVRITTNFNHGGLSSILSVLHEAGHAIYDLNMPRKYSYTILYDAPSFGAHESQSKFWEEIIGKSKPFWKYYFPRFNKKFKLNMNFEDWYRYVNQITKDPIRINSDEIAYCLHIILRFELESRLIDGSIEVKDLPGIWNENMEEYLGIEPKNDSEGVLQDVHWAHASIGYFPSYAIGVVYASQLYKKMLQDIKNIDIQIENGNFNNVTNWLRKNFHEYGNTMTAEEIMKKTCKEGLNPDVFIKYLNKKYSGIYEL